MVALTVFSLTLKSQADEDAFLSAFKKLQEHCVRNEPGTLTYEVHQCVQDGKPVPHKFCVVERYNSAKDFEEIHLKSKPFAEFFKTLGTLGVAEQGLATYNNEEVQGRLDAMTLSAEDVKWICQDSAIPKGFLVFGGARHGKNPAYTAEARKLGEYIAAVQASETDAGKRRPLVYGGGTVGIMGEVAQTVKKHNGMVISIIPNALRPREASGEMIGDVLYFTSNMSERKSIMFAHADCVVAMPGGVGTFDELLEVLTLYQLNAYRPKIGLVNVDGFFNPFLTLLDNLIGEGFVEATIKDLVLVDDSATGLMKKMETFVPPESPSRNLVWHSRP